MNLSSKRAISAKNRVIAHSLCYQKNLSSEKKSKQAQLQLIKFTLPRDRPSSSDSAEDKFCFKGKQNLFDSAGKQQEKREDREGRLKKNRTKRNIQNLSLKKKQLQSCKGKNFLGSKLEKKIDSYFLFLGLASCRLGVKFMKKNQPKYVVYVGKGNNCKLLKRLFQIRHWWTLVNDPNHEDINLIWTQWSKKAVFNTLSQNFREFQEGKAFYTKKICPSNQFSMIIPQKYKEKYKKNIEFQWADLKSYVSSYRNINQEPICRITRTFNHVEGHQVLTDKKNLFYCMQQYFNNRMKSCFEVLPLTFHIEPEVLEENIKEIHQKCVSLEVDPQKIFWILKPGEQCNRGRGIKVLNSLNEVKNYIEKNGEKKKDRTFILQKYLAPALFHRRKFDIRCFVLLIANPSITAYFYHDAYLRTSSKEYKQKNIDDKFIHLTNDAIQKKGTEYGKFEKGNKVSLEEYQSYLDLFQKNKEVNFKQNIFTKIKVIATKSVKAAVESRELNKSGIDYSFQLLGYDFMIDQNYQPWLIEVNTNPSIETGCPLLEKFMPSLLNNVFKLAVDPVFRPQKVHEWPLQSAITFPQIFFEPNRFEIIYGHPSEVELGCLKKLRRQSAEMERK